MMYANSQEWCALGNNDVLGGGCTCDRSYLYISIAFHPSLIFIDLRTRIWIALTYPVFSPNDFRLINVINNCKGTIKDLNTYRSDKAPSPNAPNSTPPKKTMEACDVFSSSSQTIFCCKWQNRNDRIYVRSLHRYHDKRSLFP